MPSPVPPDLVKVQLNFGLGTDEIAVSGFHVRLHHEGGAPTNWAEMTDDLAGKIADSWKDKVSGTMLPVFPKNVVLRDVSTYHLDAATGHALDKGTAPATGDRAWAGTGATSLPLECSLAVSLFGYPVGGFLPDRGRRRGRMYLPPLSNNVMADADPETAGRLHPATHPIVTAAIGSFFNDVQGKSVGQDPLGIGQYWDLVVVSRAGVFATLVDHVAVGDVIDVQRRRRDKQRESYRTVQVTPGG